MQSLSKYIELKAYAFQFLGISMGLFLDGVWQALSCLSILVSIYINIQNFRNGNNKRGNKMDSRHFGTDRGNT